MALVVKNLPANSGDMGSIPGSGRSPGGGNGNQLSVLTWKIDSGACGLHTVYGMMESDTTEHACTHGY